MSKYYNGRQITKITYGNLDISKRYQMNNVVFGSNSTIPDEPELPYIELEYLNIPTGSYFDTNVKMDKEIIWELDIAPIVSGNTAYYAGSSGGSQYTRIGIYQQKWYVYNTSGPAATNGVRYKVKYTLPLKTSSVGWKMQVDNGTTYTGSTSRVSTINTTTLRSRYSTSYNGLCGKYYKMDITYDGTKVSDYIPVKRRSDNVVCFYNKIDETYLLPASGTWEAGPEVSSNPVLYTRLQYITWDNNSGFQSLVDGSSQKYKMSIEFSPSSVSGVKHLGVGKDNDYRAFGLDGSTWTLWEYNGNKTLSTAAVANQKYTVNYSWDRSASTISLNVGSETVSTSHWTWTASNHVATPFSFWGSSGGFAGKIYSIKEYLSDVLVHDLIPVKDLNGNTAFYDSVDDEYYYATEGTWVAGPNL